MTRIHAFIGALLPLATAASVSAPVPGAPDSYMVHDYLQHFTSYYCPFKVDGAVAKDLSQLVVTYDLSKPGKAFPGPGHEMECLFRVLYVFTPGKNEYRFTEIEHSGVEKVNLEVSTKTVLDLAFGPVSWMPVNMKDSSRMAKNATNSVWSLSGHGDVNIKTTFKTPTSLKDLTGKLTQTFKMEWAGAQADHPYEYYTCDQPDNQGNADNGLCIQCRYWGDDPHPGCKRDT